MEDRKYPTRSAENIFRMLMRSKPNSPAYWPDGRPGPDIEFGDNPVVICTNQTGYERDKRYVLNGDFGVNIKVPYVEGLTLKATVSLDKTFRFRKIWQNLGICIHGMGLRWMKMASPYWWKERKGLVILV